MSQKEIDILKRALERERASRKAAEKVLEDKATELYYTKQKLEESYAELQNNLTKTDSQLQGVFENMVDAYVLMDMWGSNIQMNGAAQKLLGFSDPYEKFYLLDLALPGEHELIADSFHRLQENGTITDFQVRIKTRKLEVKLLHINASIIFDNGKPYAVQSIVRDITQAKEEERKLIESESRLSTLILNFDAGVLLEDENRKIIVTNTRFCELFEITTPPETLKGQDCTRFAEHSKHLFKEPNDFVSRIDSILEKRKPVLGEEIHVANGRILERDYIPIFRGNDYKGHLWKYKDITLSRKYRKSIEAQRLKYRSIITNMNLGLLEVDNNDRILMANHSFMEMTGYTESELIGKLSRDIFPAEKTLVDSELENKEKGLANSYEIKTKNKAGQTRHWLISGGGNYNLNGERMGSIRVHLDITALKSLQFQKENLLRKVEKSNNELQEYAHIVSHDLKSPLRAIYALVSWLKEDNKDKLDEASLTNFAHIETTLEKMEQLISDVLEYSSLGFNDTKNTEVDLQEAITDLIGILYAPDHIKIQIKQTLPVIKGDKTKLKQLFQNLISNAIKFIDKEKGLIEIDCVEHSKHYQFSIKDNGIGIEKKFHEKIFKMFHSLNKSKDSTGIGLSIVKKIVELHDGRLWLESEPNVGTTFYFTIKK